MIREYISGDCGSRKIEKLNRDVEISELTNHDIQIINLGLHAQTTGYKGLGWTDYRSLQLDDRDLRMIRDARNLIDKADKLGFTVEFDIGGNQDTGPIYPLIRVSSKSKCFGESAKSFAETNSFLWGWERGNGARNGSRVEETRHRKHEAEAPTLEGSQEIVDEPEEADAPSS